MKKAILLMFAVLISVSITQAQEKHDLLELSLGYGLGLPENEDMLNTYRFHGPEVILSIKPVRFFSIGGLYKYQNAMLGDYLNPQDPKAKSSSLGGELKIFIIPTLSLFARAGSIKIEDFLVSGTSYEGSFTHLGGRFGTKKYHTLGLFIEGGYEFVDIEELGSPLDQINLSMGVTINL